MKKYITLFTFLIISIPCFCQNNNGVFVKGVVKNIIISDDIFITQTNNIVNDNFDYYIHLTIETNQEVILFTLKSRSVNIVYSYMSLVEKGNSIEMWNSKFSNSLSGWEITKINGKKVNAKFSRYII